MLDTIAGATFIIIGVTTNYGFLHLDAIPANNLIITNAVFGLILGIAVYKEFPSMSGYIGGVLVMCSAILSNQASLVSSAKQTSL